MITVVQTSDMSWLNRMVNHPDIAPHVRDDSSPETIDISQLSETQSVFLRIDANGTPVGFGIFVFLGNDTYELHSGMLKGFRGSNALDAGRKGLCWMRDNTGCREITTWAFSCAKNVMIITRMLGFREVSRSPWPATVCGLRVDRVNYSISTDAIKGV